MPTLHRTERQTKAEYMSVQQAVKEIIDIEVEDDVDDPLEGLTDAEIADIYKKLKPEDRRLFSQFKRFHKTYYNLHGHDIPSHQLAWGIVSEIFSGLQLELLAAERLKDLCKQLGLAIPAEL